MARLIENYIPVIKWDGLNTNKNVTVGGGATIDFTAAGSVKLPASVVVSAAQDYTPASDATNAFEFTNAADSAIVFDIDTTNQRIGIGNGAATPGYSLDVQGSSAANSRLAVTSANAGALSVGLTIANPAFNVDSSTASQVAGLNVKGAVTGGVVAVAAIDSGSNASLTLDGKGTGTLKLNSVSTTAGIVTIGNSTSLLGAVINGPIQVNNNKAAINSTNTATAAQVATGYITSTSAAGTTITLPTGTLLGAQLGATQGTIFDLTIDNTAGANTVTIAVAVNGILSALAAAEAGGSGLLTIPSGVTGQGVFRLMFSSATAYTFSRIA